METSEWLKGGKVKGLPVLADMLVGI